MNKTFYIEPALEMISLNAADDVLNTSDEKPEVELPDIEL